MKRVMVIGATGMLGEPVAWRLKHDGFSVRILARDLSRTRARFKDTTWELVEGDVSDPASLVPAFQGCFGVHINLSGEIEGVGTQNVVSAALKAGIKRITYISGTSVTENNLGCAVIERKFTAEAAIQESGIPYNIFCPTWFMESLPKFVKGSKAYIFGEQPNPYHFVAAVDYARMVSASYMLERAANTRLFIHGPEGLMFRDALQRYCRVMHPEVKKISTMPYWLAVLLGTLAGKREMKSISKFMEFFEKSGEKGDPAQANRLLGKPTTTFDEWLKLQAQAKSFW